MEVKGMVRATTIDYGVALSANTVDALLGSDSEDNETPDLSRNAAVSAFMISQLDASTMMDVTEQTVVIGALQRLLLEADPDPYSGDESAEAKGRSRRNAGRYRELYDAADEAEAYKEDEEDDDAFDVRGTREETVKDYIRSLSFDAAEEDSTQYLEVRSHASLDKIAELEGKRYRSDASPQWLKRFIYEMKSIRMPQSAWCEPFSLCLGRAAKRWYRQLPKKTQRRWKLLSEAFLDYYCSQFDQPARTRYYSATRKVNEPICDFLIRPNGYAPTAKVQYEKGGADAADHVEHFLLHCGDGDVIDFMYPLQLEDIARWSR
ncbi:hypothetical protein PInf_015568 [Phytophthora infestans]|nr:hypothetical protein PInf_015568 [Phytophthora infestans]